MALRAEAGRVLLSGVLGEAPRARLCLPARRRGQRRRDRAALHALRAGCPHGYRRHHAAGALAGEPRAARRRAAERAPGRADPDAVARGRRRLVGRTDVKTDLLLIPMGGTYRAMRDAAVAAEESGFDGLWTWDHLRDPERGAASHVPEAWTVL